MQNIGMASLRSFVSAVEVGGFTRAAVQMNRTPGAISLQMKTLEERLGVQLFAKVGKHQQLTSSGELLLDYARRILRANDEALVAIRGVDQRGFVRLGMPQGLPERCVTEVLIQFSRAVPACRMEIKVGRCGDLETSLADGSLDLIFNFGPREDSDPDQVATMPVLWWAAPNLLVDPEAPVPLLTLRSCYFRDTSIRTLETARIPFWIALESDSVSATWSAAAAGLGFLARPALYVPEGLQLAGAEARLPPLGDVGVFLRTRSGPLDVATTYLRDILHDILVSRCQVMSEVENILV